MPVHLQMGRDGEAAAVKYLQGRDYRIIALNWRHKHLEVDIIAEDGGILTFVEVKTRTGTAYGLPFEFVDAAKQAKLVRAANHYIATNRYGGEIRFDVVSMLYAAESGTYDIQLIKDAFWPD